MLVGLLLSHNRNSRKSHIRCGLCKYFLPVWFVFSFSYQCLSTVGILSFAKSRLLICSFIIFYFYFLFFCFSAISWAAPMAYGGSQARGLIRAIVPAYARATATRDQSRICDLHHRSWQRQILNPQSKARDLTHNFMVPSRIH